MAIPWPDCLTNGKELFANEKIIVYLRCSVINYSEWKKTTILVIFEIMSNVTKKKVTIILMHKMKTSITYKDYQQFTPLTSSFHHFLNEIIEKTNHLEKQLPSLIRLKQPK